MSPETIVALDRLDGRRVLDARGVLRAFNDALVLSASDVHVAQRLGRITGERGEEVLLAAALAARAPRLGHVCVDLAVVAGSALSDADETVDVASLPWPEPEAWLGRLAASPMVVCEGDSPQRAGAPSPAPLRLAGTCLYLDRYWRQEQLVAADMARRGTEPGPVDIGVLSDGLDRLFGTEPGTDLQRLAAAVAVLRRLSVIAGGPGTGKTTTVARVVALLDDQATATGVPLPKVALAAPTGKAAARLQEGVRAEAKLLEVTEATRRRLAGLSASTIHRLLGTRPDSQSRFRHDATNRLPYDAVIVDETSMVALSLMARLVEALRPDARLILLGDPDQLSSIEAGAVLGDIVGPAAERLRMTPAARRQAAAATGRDVPATDTDLAVGDGIVVLRRVFRFGGGIAALSEAIRAGDRAATVAALGSDPGTVTWSERGDDALEAVRASVVDAGRAVAAAAAAGDGQAALDALGRMRILCAHRHGPDGVSAWTARAEGWLAAAVAGYGTGGRWYLGRPLLVTQNDYELNLSNGDVGVVVDVGARRLAVFQRAGELVYLAPTRLEAVETVHAMTIHKSQGSQFDTVAVVLPGAESRLLTRELLYTAVTRARSRVQVIGDEAAIAAALDRRLARASGLRRHLWGAEPWGAEPPPAGAEAGRPVSR